MLGPLRNMTQRSIDIRSGIDLPTKHDGIGRHRTRCSRRGSKLRRRTGRPSPTGRERSKSALRASHLSTGGLQGCSVTGSARQRYRWGWCLGSTLRNPCTIQPRPGLETRSTLRSGCSCCAPCIAAVAVPRCLKRRVTKGKQLIRTSSLRQLSHQQGARGKRNHLLAAPAIRGKVSCERADDSVFDTNHLESK